MYGLTPDEIKEIRKVFYTHPAVEEAILYGSRAKGNYRPNSDIDITLKGQYLSLQEFFTIENEIDDLFHPYKVDLSIFSKIDNQDLIEHIERVGLLFYSKNEKVEQ